MKIDIKTLDNGKILINTEFAELLRHNGLISARKLWEMRSDPVKNILEERGTGRFLLESPDSPDYVETFIKRYRSPSLREKIKNWTSLKFAKYDALHEWNAICAFHEHGLNTMKPMAAAVLGVSSCNLTLGISDYKRASDIFAELRNEAGSRVARLALVKKIAEYAGKMHAAGFSHQDMYLVHFFIKGIAPDFEVYLIDLQRVRMSSKIGRAARIKDLGQLLFSANGLLSRTDAMRFWKIYCNIAGMELYRNKSLISGVLGKALRIERHDAKRRQKKQLENAIAVK